MLKGSCDSLGTKSLSESDRPTSSDNGQRPCEKQSFSQSLEAEKISVTFTDLSIFGDTDNEVDLGDDNLHGYQYTLAILKPEAAGLMYKIESIMDRNGFIVKTVCTLLYVHY